jgi:energy-coupling factor transporter ATP-binding protein EcfA2
MPSARVVVSTPIVRTPRVQQVEGLFDLPPTQQAELSWDVALPLEERPWHVGLVVGPSGCGKSTIARHLWPYHFFHAPAWPADRSVLDAFPDALPIKEVVSLLSAVGFASPPAWLRPFHVLSTGQQFRVTLARLLAECPDLAVMDEYTSVVDRTVAQVGSHALARTVRAREQKFIAITCHEDVEPWLNPDWVYRPAEGRFTWRLLQRRPTIPLLVCRVDPSAWTLFRHHHYLSAGLNRSATCLCAFWDGRPVAFSAWLNALTKRGGKREHRTVTLPDYQGAGIGHALSTFCASLWKGLGYRAISTTAHPAFVAARLRSPHWRLTRAPGLARVATEGKGKPRHATTRLTAGFEYVGPGMAYCRARALLG